MSESRAEAFDKWFDPDDGGNYRDCWNAACEWQASRAQPERKLTDAQAHEILCRMSEHVEDWADRLAEEPSAEQCSGEALRFLLAAQPAAATVPEWQPIETAPKDGTNVLLINRKGNMATGLWQGNGEFAGWWLRGGNTPNVFFNHHHGPTHWMPLPAPPAAQAQDDGVEQ